MEKVMKQLRSTVLALGALAAVAALAAAAASGSVPECTHSRVVVKMTEIKNSFGAGHVSYRLTVHNNGPGSCLMSTYPPLQLLTAKEKRLPTNVIRTEKPKTNLIPMGETAKATLRFSPDIPGPREPQTGPCETKAAKISVELSSSRAVGPVEPPTSVCQHGKMTMTPLG